MASKRKAKPLPEIHITGPQLGQMMESHDKHLAETADDLRGNAFLREMITEMGGNPDEIARMVDEERAAMPKGI